MSGEFEQRLRRLAETQVPAPPTIDQLRARDRRRAARRVRGALACVAAVVAVFVATSVVRGDEGREVISTGGPSSPTTSVTSTRPPTSRPAEAIGVVGDDGSYRGTADRAATEARDARIEARLEVDVRAPLHPDDVEHELLWEALAVLDPVPVRDGEGNVVGYWTSHFVTAEELEAAVPDAQRTVADLLDP